MNFFEFMGGLYIADKLMNGNDNNSSSSGNGNTGLEGCVGCFFIIILIFMFLEALASWIGLK